MKMWLTTIILAISGHDKEEFFSSDKILRKSTETLKIIPYPVRRGVM